MADGYVLSPGTWGKLMAFLSKDTKELSASCPGTDFQNLVHV